eukprot:g31343.t1
MDHGALPPAVRILLHEGWQLSTVAFFHRMPDEEIRSMLPVMARAWTPGEMDGLRHEAKRQKRLMDIEDGAFYHHQKLLYKDASMVEKTIGNLASTVSEVGTSLVLARKTMPRVTWKSHLQKALANAPDDQHRAKAEEKERQRWIGELMKLLEEAGFLDSLARDPEATKQLALRVAAGRRASTLRQHVKYGRRVQVYMESIYGTAWLRSPGDFIGYVALLLEEPCGRSATSYWSEHSERVTIMSWALIAEVPRETRRRWGRWSPGVDEEYAVTSKRVVMQAQARVAEKIKAQYCITDYTDDKSVLNNFALWLQAVHGKTPTQAHKEIMKIAPPTWGGMGNGPFHVLSKPLKKKAESSEALEVVESPTEVFSDDELMDDPAPEERHKAVIKILKGILMANLKGTFLNNIKGILVANLKGNFMAFFKGILMTYLKGILTENLEGILKKIKNNRTAAAEEKESCRGGGDRPSEIHFRRLRAWAEVVQDPDSRFLEGMASMGVPLGTRAEIPWISAVFDKREKKGPEDQPARWEEVDFRELRGNYTSAKEHMEKVRAHVESDLEKGWMVKVTFEEAKKRYGDELQVASLGAVPKDPQWSDVRVVHDGTLGLRVNTHLDQPNKMVFPQYDDLEAVLREFKKEAGPRRFMLAFDVKAAHRLIPVQERDWGLQACRLDKEEEVFLNTRGTFGVASAAFWWGRLAGLLFRVFHQVLPQEVSLYLMLFADDGLLLTSGEHCHTLVFALFIYLEVMEVPLSWPKTRGGLETEWIGYTVDLKNWTLGVSKRKVEWLNSWGKLAVSEGRMLGREFRAGLGRMGFLAGAIKVARPFLAPLYAAIARVPGGTYFELHMAVKLAIAFFQEMVGKAPMKSLSAPPKVLGEIFRVDAMADQDGVAIGGASARAERGETTTCGRGSTKHAMSEWSPQSWRSLPKYQMAEWEDEAVADKVFAKLGKLPPLVQAKECDRLKSLLAEAGRGERFMVQGGDCAERFLDCESERLETQLKLILQMGMILEHISGKQRPQC